MIYLCEDDDNIRELVIYTLQNVGLEAEGFPAPCALDAAMKRRLPELILLDIMLPEQNGLDILSGLKANEAAKHIPVILLTAKDSEIDKVRGFERGADDYIAKPFGMMELVARVRARLRSARTPGAKPSEYTVGTLTVAPARRSVQVAGQEVSLTRKEFEMLCCLLENRGLVLTRDQLLERVWGYSFDGESRTVDVHIRTLRQKLGAAGEYIETVRGIGYKLGEAEG